MLPGSVPPADPATCAAQGPAPTADALPLKGCEGSIATPWHDVQVRWFDLDADWPEGFDAALSPEEQSRAARFRSARDARRYRAAHAMLRDVLAARAGVPATQLKWATSAAGKPRLAGADGLEFSLSHSGRLAVMAMSPRILGIDLEHPRALPGWPALESLARRCLSAGEWTRWTALPASEQPPSFLDAWARKEACTKAWGTGLNIDLRDIEAGWGPGVRTARAPQTGFPGAAIAPDAELELFSISLADGASVASLALAVEPCSRQTPDAGRPTATP